MGWVGWWGSLFLSLRSLFFFFLRSGEAAPRQPVVVAHGTVFCEVQKCTLFIRSGGAGGKMRSDCSILLDHVCHASTGPPHSQIKNIHMKHTPKPCLLVRPALAPHFQSSGLISLCQDPPISPTRLTRFCLDRLRRPSGLAGRRPNRGG